MAKYLKMPKLADTMTEGTLLKWLKQVGDKVEIGDVVAEVETDKATMEMEAFDDGIVHEHLVAEGEKVPVGRQIALLLQKGEKPPASPAATASASPAKGSSVEAKPADAASTRQSSSAVARTEADSGEKKPAGAGDARQVKSSPLARKLAREKSVDLANLRGSGPGGRIVARDIEAASAVRGQSASSSQASPPERPAQAGEGDKRLPLSGMRRVIAERLLASKTQIPHFYLNIEVDAGPLMRLRAELNEAAEKGGGPKLTVNDFVLKGILTAAVKAPAVNASFAGDAIIQYAEVHLAVAVAVEDGLVTPVIRGAQRRSLRELSEAVKDLAARARSKKLKPEEYSGGTITVSNLGSYGIDNFSAIINPPQAMILSIGAIVKKPVVGPGDQVVVGHRMSIGLSADHRVIDGAIGAQFLSELRKVIETPALMFL